MRILIIANSPERDAELVRRCAAEADRIVVADGGVHRLPEGVIPHTVCGDFDSLEMAEARRLFPHSDFIHLPDQSSCDLEKAIEFSCSAGGTDIVIVSALGGRPDHSFGTYSVLCKYSQRVSLELRHERMTCRAFSAGAGGTQATSLAVRENSTVSLLPYGEGAVVSLTGTVWELHKAPLPVGAAGVSNRATGELLSLTVHAGTVLAFTELPEWVQD